MHLQSLIPVQQSELMPGKATNRHNRIYPLTKEGTSSTAASLETSLLPLWKITSYSFVLLGWYKKLPENNRLITILRYSWIALYLSLMVLVMIFFLYRLELQVVKTDSTIQSIIPYLMWFCNYPLYLTSAFIFLARRKELLILFRDWMQMEQQFHPITNYNQQPKDYRRLYFCVYALYACHGISTLIGTTTITIGQPEAPFLLSNSTFLRETLTLPGLVILQQTTFVIGWIFVLLADLVPAWTFYHAGLALQSIGNQIEILRPSNVRRIRFQYEVVSRLVERVNQIFGGLIVLDHITLFSMICALSYNILKTFKDPNADLIRFSVGILFFVLRLTVPILMASHLHSAGFKLRARLAAAISDEAIIMNSEESSHRSTLLLNWMNQNHLAARPLNLYNIHPTILMTMTSLIISYVIVLLQSQ